MLKRRALMESISSNLHGFLKRIGNNLSVLDKKFLRDSLIGLLRCSQPVVCQMARHVPNQRTRFLSRLDRLEAHLVKDSDFDDTLKNALPHVWLPFVRDDLPSALHHWLSPATTFPFSVSSIFFKALTLFTDNLGDDLFQFGRLGLVRLETKKCA